MKLIIGFLLFASVLIAGTTDKGFNIEEVSIKIYDNSLNNIVLKPINVYGNNMNLFIAIKVSQTDDKIQKYKLELKAYGKGRENAAEGLVKDYHVDISKKVILYSDEAIFVPFILEYPCTKEETFVITLTNEQNEKVSKKIVNNLTSCYLN